MLSSREAGNCVPSAQDWVDPLRILLIACCAVWILAGTLPVMAQHEGHVPKNTIGWVPRDLLERPLPLRQGIGKVHEEVTTSSPEAQAYYDQGLAYLNSYVWIEAARSFNEALRLDPGLAMAYLGLSDAYIGLQDLPAAMETFKKAQTLADKLSDVEKARITIRARQLDYLQESGNLQKYFAYRQAVLDALTAHPDDPWLWILRGFADEGTPTAHGQSGGADTMAFYEMVLKLAPDSFIPHHYMAHTFENRGPVNRALEESQIYVRMAPAIPHAHHMHGHELRRAGRTEEAIQEFLKAEELEDAYYRAENIPPRLDWHYAHNLQLLAMSYEALGQMKAAEAAFRQAYMLPAYVDLADYNRKAWPEFLLSRGRSQEALVASEELTKSKWALARFAGHALAGRALLAMNRVEDAKNELPLAEQETEHLPITAIKTLQDTVLLRAEIMLNEKNWDEGNSLMERIEKNILAVPGPDAWSGALFQLEYIARMARDAGDWELAESTAQKMIEHDPSYAGGYLALGLVAKQRGNAATANQEFAKAEKLWSKADADLQLPQTQKP